LRGLEQARRSALAHHVHRIAPMGARVLINGIRYNVYGPGSYVAASDAASLRLGAIPGQVSDDEFVLAQDRSRGAGIYIPRCVFVRA
jgi:hypothetical protein